jgi:glycosyltransferase involved in cell wall biosynthesis
MNLLFLSPSANLGGAERVLIAMAVALRTQTHLAPHVLVLGSGPLLDVLGQHGVPATSLPLPGALARLGDSQLHEGATRLGVVAQLARAVPGLLPYLRRFRQAIHAAQPALIHSNGIKTHLLGRLACPSAPTIWHVHDFFGQRRLASHLLGWAARRAQGAIAISQAVADDFRSIAPRLPIEVILNTVDVDRFRPQSVDAARLDHLAGLPPAPAGVVRIGLLATYARWKGHDVFLKAAAQLLRDAPRAPVRFYIIGGPVYCTDGSQFTPAELRRAARDLGSAEHVGFIEFQDAPERIYPALDVVVHASTRPEPFGLTIVEAMACGCAVVAAHAGGAAEIVDPGRNALGTPPGDVPALTQALQTLLADAALRARLGAAGRQTALTRFAAPRLADQLMAAYRPWLPEAGTEAYGKLAVVEVKPRGPFVKM